MDIKFKDVNTGKVEARASIEIMPGINVNEITIIRNKNEIDIEYPQKSFKGKDGNMHYIDIITFENENKKLFFTMQIKDEYAQWRAKNKKVLIYNPE